jgi:NADPH:quinone reductase-like Zn-dependent oxidoreductase
LASGLSLITPPPTQLSEIGQLIDGGEVWVCVEKVLLLTQAGEAQEYLEQEYVRGKVVLRVTDGT